MAYGMSSSYALLLVLLALCCSFSLVASTATLRGRLQGKEKEKAHLGAGSLVEVMAAPDLDWAASSYTYNVHFMATKRKMTPKEKTDLKELLKTHDKDDEEIEEAIEGHKKLKEQELACCSAQEVDGAMNAARLALEVPDCPSSTAGPNINFGASKTFVYTNAVEEVTTYLQSETVKVPVPDKRGELPYYQPTSILHLYDLALNKGCDSKYVRIGQHIIYQVGSKANSLKTCYFFYHGTVYPTSAGDKPALNNFKVDYPTLGASLGGLQFTRAYINGVLGGTKAATPQAAVVIAAVFIAEVYRNYDTYYFNLAAMDLKGTVDNYLKGKCPGDATLWTTKVSNKDNRCNAGVYGGLHNMAWGKSTVFVSERRAATVDAGPPIALMLQRWHHAKWLDSIGTVLGKATVDDNEVEGVVKLVVDNKVCAKACFGGDAEKKAKINGKNVLQELFTKLNEDPVESEVELEFNFKP